MKTSFFKTPIFWILLIAFILRIIGVFEGLPAIYNSTEHFLAKFTLKMAAERSLDPGFYIYPSFYQYVLAVLYGLYFLTGILFGIFRDSYDFAVQFLVDPTYFYVLTRSISTIVSVISIWFLYRFVMHFRDERTAIWTAVIMSLSYYSIHFARLATQESFLIFFTILAIIYFWKSQNQNNPKFIFWAGIFGGLAIASKYNAGFLIFGLYLTGYYSWKKFGGKLKNRIILSTSGLLLGFFLTNPYLVYAPQKYIQGFLLVTEQMYQGISLERGINYLWEIKEIILHEWILGFIFLISLIYALIKKNHFYYTLLSVAIPTFFYVGSWPKKGIDYLIVCWPIFFIFSSMLIVDLLNKYSRNLKIQNIILSVIFIPSILYNSHQTILTILPDTRQLASEWLLQNMKPDDKICYDQNGFDLYLIDLHRYTEYGYSAELLPKEVKSRLLSLKNIKNNVRFVSSIKKNDKSNLLKQSYMQWKTIGDLYSEGVKFIIINSAYRLMYMNNEINNNSSRFYSSLESEFKPTKIFRPDIITNGPEMKIYQIID